MFKAFNLCSSGSHSWLLGHYYFTYFVRYNHLHLKNFLAAFCIPFCTIWVNLRNSTHLSHFLPSGLSSENLPRDTSEVPIVKWGQLCYLVISTPLLPLRARPAVSEPQSLLRQGQARAELPISTTILSLHPLGHRTSPFPSLHVE